MSDYLSVARRMWHQLEPLHATLYSAPEALRVAAGIGFDTMSRWPRYFAWRTAPLGAAGPGLVAATYYTFSPRLIAQHIPRIWSTAGPAEVLDARLRAVDQVLSRLLGDRLSCGQLAEAAGLARRAAENAGTTARPLAAANLDLPWPEAPHLMLWQSATVLREHRGDGHLAALLTCGLDPCEALVSHAATGNGADRGWAAPESAAARGWSAQEWSDAHDRLAARGWIAPDGSATLRGRRERAALEQLTDQLAAGPWRALGRARAERLAHLLRPLADAVFAAGILTPDSAPPKGTAPGRTTPEDPPPGGALPGDTPPGGTPQGGIPAGLLPGDVPGARASRDMLARATPPGRTTADGPVPGCFLPHVPTPNAPTPHTPMPNEPMPNAPAPHDPASDEPIPAGAAPAGTAPAGPARASSP